MAGIKPAGFGPGAPRGAAKDPLQGENQSQEIIRGERQRPVRKARASGDAIPAWITSVPQQYPIHAITALATRQVSSLLPDPSSAADIAYRLYTSGTGTPVDFPYRFTIVADTNHSDIGNLTKFEDTLRNFAASGGRHVIMELRNKHQKLFYEVKTEGLSFDAVADRLPTPRLVPAHQRMEARAAYGRIMQIALDNNMEFHARDIPPIAAIKAYPDVYRFVYYEVPNAGENTKELFASKMADGEFSSRYKAFYAAMEPERRANDVQLVRYMNEVVGKDEKAIILYGAGHAVPIARGLGDESQLIFMVNPEKDAGGIKYTSLPLRTFFESPDNSKYNTYMASTSSGAWMARSHRYQAMAGRTGFGTAAGLNIWAAYGVYNSIANPASNFRRGVDAGGLREGAEVTGLSATGVSILTGTAGVTLAVRPAFQTAKGVGAALLRGGSRVATPIAIAATVIEGTAGYVSGDADRVARATGAGTGAIAGATALGLAFAWTGPGALVAAALGGLGGAIIGGMAGEAWLDRPVNYVMNVTGKDTAKRADSDIGHAFGPSIADYLAKAHDAMKAFDDASLVQDMAKAAQAGEKGAVIYRVLQAELLRREQTAVIERAKVSRSGNVSLTAGNIAAMTAEIVKRLQKDGKITADESRLALAGRVTEFK
jgi:hypothetical protein